MLKITIVTVCYNAEKDIEQTLKSVVNQTYKNIEYIIVDGFSTDKTMDIIKKYKNHISCIVSEPDNGIYDAMNKGARIATGDYIQFLNAGDIIYNNNVFENIFGNGIDSNVDVIYGDIIYHMCFGDFYKIPAPIETFNYTFPIAHPASFVKRIIFKNICFDTKYKIAADFAFFKAIYGKGYHFLYIPNIPIVYFDSISGVSSKNVYKAWYEFNVVLGNNHGHIWVMKKLGKKILIIIKNTMKSFLTRIDEKYYREISVRKQLKNKYFRRVL